MQSQLPDKEAASATTAIGDAPPPATSTSSEIKELAAYDENDESSFYQIESTEAFKNGEIAGFLYNGYVDDVCVLEVLPNNKLAAGSFDGTIKVWDVHDLSNRLNNVDLLHTLKCKSGVNCLAALEQDLLAAGCSGGAVELWDVQTGSRVRLLAISEAAPELKAKVGGDEVSALAVLSQSRLATAFGSAIVIWNWQTGEKTQVLSNGTAQVRALALLDNGNLASGDEKGYIFIWDLSVGKTVNKLFQLSAVDKLVVLADDMLASVCDEDIDIFCTKPGSTTRSRVACLKGLWDFVTDLAVSQDRRKLVSCSAAPIVRIWENESCAPATASKNSSPTNCWVEKHNYGFFEDQYDRIIRAVAILPNGRVFSDYEDCIVMWAD